jgi:broad specificity phosphatase PhoE
VSSRKKIIVDFMRHGEPEGGEVLRGRVDHPLGKLGWQQMQLAAAPGLVNGQSAATSQWTDIISSPLQRCRAFAEKLANLLDLKLLIDDRWQEIDYGDWDGMLLSEWRALAAPQFKAFREDLSKLAPPNGEDYLTFRDRVLGAWQELSQKADGSHVLIVTHGGVLRVVLPTVLGMPLNRSTPLHIPFASFSRVSLQIEAGRVDARLLFHNAAEYAAG